MLSSGINLKDVEERLVNAARQEHGMESRAYDGLAHQLERLRAKRDVYKS